MFKTTELPWEQHMYKVWRVEYQFKLFMRPEQMNIMRIRNILQKLTKLENQTVDAFSQTIFVANVYLHIPKRRKFFGCKTDFSYMTEVVPQLILLCAGHMFREYSDVNRDHQCCTATNVYVKEVEAVEVQKCLYLQGFRRVFFHPGAPDAHAVTTEYTYRYAGAHPDGKDCFNKVVMLKM